MNPLLHDEHDLQLRTSHAVLAASTAARRVLSLETVEGWLDCSLLRFPFFNVVASGRPISPDETCSARVVAGHAEDGYVDGAKVRAWLARGATLVLANLHEWHPPARDLCRALAELYASKVGAVAFCTAAQSRGLRVHRDDCHVLVVQLAGRKRWSLYDAPRDAAAYTPGYADGEALGDPVVVEIGPGQALYIPEGQAHATEALDETSLHVSFTIREPRVHDAVTLAVRACLASVPEHTKLAGSTEDREQAARGILRRLARALGRVDTAALVSEIEKRATFARGTF